ncbi:MAG: isochorismatase family protein [Tannerella sp.]|jgi:nicotinamidase-related amidase|nr:isochorismatase family protein [Tannerella sp.]
MKSKNYLSACRSVVLLVISFTVCSFVTGQTLRISTEQREPSPYEGEQNAFIITNSIEQWKPSETAIIVCDMWDKHWCDLSTARWVELSKAIDATLAAARAKGVRIVHAPSECMEFYKDYPQRKEAQKYKNALLQKLAKGDKLPSEEGAEWPIDASDEGCEGNGSPQIVWKRQSELIQIGENDIISDSGAEIGAYFKKEGVKNVIIVGVATNMCVIGRSFGLRAMKRMGFRPFLLRDLTDVMYNPKNPPLSLPADAPDKISAHFAGIDLMVEYIEKYVCPSIVSTDFTGNKQFRFADDKRKNIAILCAEGEYHANQKLPEFAHELTLKNYHCDFALGKPYMEGPGRHNIENLQILEDADMMLLFVRRRALEPEKLAKIKSYVESGRPVLGIRVSSVAFDANKVVPREGGGEVEAKEKASEYLAQWPELDRDIWGGNYHGHYEHLKEGTDITITPGMENHPLLKGVKPFNSLNWLYQCAPLRSEKAQVFLLGSNPGKPLEPVFWTNGNKIIYTSLGHWDDWKDDSFRNLMFNSVEWLLK